MNSILILTAPFGEGHNTAAKNICIAINKLGGNDFHAEVLDLYETCYPRLTSGLQRGYKFAINRAPRVWQKIYDVLDNTRLVEKNLFTIRSMSRALQKLIQQHRPQIILSTYPVYIYLLDRMSQGQTRDFRHFMMVTDAITINSVWFRCPSDRYLVTDEVTASILRDAQVPPETIRVTGFPVSERFDLLENKGLRKPLEPGVSPKVLFLIHTESVEALLAVKGLLAKEDLEITIWVGRNAGLRKRVAALIAESGQPASILGWTQKMPEMLLQHHLVIGKAGGATVQEAIAARCPMLVSQLVPGQEEGNLRLILDNDTGRLAITAKAILASVKEAFADNAAVWRKWCENIEKIRHPEAALGIARFVLEEAQAMKSPTTQLNESSK